MPIYAENSATWDPRAFSRCTEGLFAVLLALKKKPLIRYEKNSVLSRKLGIRLLRLMLANELVYQMQQEAPLFEFRRADTPPILLILDRRNDPVTPLLNQWSYEAMVHEILGIQNCRVDLSGVPGIREELKEIVLSSDHDSFFMDNMYLTFGDLGQNIKVYLDEYQRRHKSSQNIESIDDMKRFMEDYPEFRKLSGNVTKHVALVGELSRIVEREKLLEVSELEQNLACSENHSSALKVYAYNLSAEFENNYFTNGCR
jgi:vacuolar protein sorting-associated protein 45